MKKDIRKSKINMSGKDEIDVLKSEKYLYERLDKLRVENQPKVEMNDRNFLPSIPN
jgi:hypothetical protein